MNLSASDVGYYSQYYDAMLAYAYASASTQFEPPRPKKRKLETPSTSTSTTVATPSDTSRLIVDKRGHVTFRPYSDSLDSPRQSYFNFYEIQSPLFSSRLGFPGSMPTTQLRKPDHHVTDDKSLVQGSTIGNLFPEILSTIFEYLDVQAKGRAAQVCTRWRDAAYRKSVWRNVEAKLHLQRSNPALFPSLVKRGIKKVQVLSLKKSLRELVIGIPNLESLNLSGCYNLSDCALEVAFSREVPSLKELNLSLCKEITDSSIRKISVNCKNIEVLDLAGCSKITNIGMFLISGLEKMRKLNLRSCRQISDPGIGGLCTLSSRQMKNALEELCLQDCQKLTDESLRHISCGMPNLEKINLSFCISITDTGLKSLAKLASLKELNLRSCDNISDIGLGFISETGLGIQKLDISFCANISDTGMKHLAMGMTSLRSLHLTTCSIGNEGLTRLAKALSGLEDLSIGQCVSITDEGLLSLVDNTNQLKSLDLYGCPKVTSNALALIRKLPKLERLNLEL